MSTVDSAARQTGDTSLDDVDAVVVGAGFAGLYAVHRLRNESGLSVRAFEAGDSVGGTWYWNRYPGARSDSDSYIYCYTFDDALLAEWEWSERYPQQPEILRYLEHVADRFDLKRSITFGARVTEATFDEASKRWIVSTDGGDVVRAQFLLGAVGCLSSSNVPQFPGLDTFAGKTYHTGAWPHAGVDFTAKRVGIIGTGASAVQAIPIIAAQAKRLTVFQRTPNYCVPARNGKVDPDVARARKANYPAIKEAIRNSYFGFELDFIGKSALEATPEERERVFDDMWDRGGFPFWLANYQDMFFSLEANEVCADYLRRKIRQTVFDPAVAEKLTPTTYPYGTKRQPLDSNYFETFNRSNVALVDVNETPIVEIVPDGIRTSAETFDLDILVLGTGFDAMTGPLRKMNVRGRGGVALADVWADGPQSYLGLMVADFPNFFTITGPGSPSVLSNMPVSIEQHVEWISDCIAYLRANGHATIEPTRDAQTSWTAHVDEVANASLMPSANSWYMGRNIPGKPQVFMPYLGGVGPYRAKCAEIAAGGYDGFSLTT
ncbi:MAG: NAD(P)/FAD-dependent oxidoreductase [Vulcanimicrobiaceae bacterium]